MEEKNTIKTFEQVINERFSCRAFKPNKISTLEIEKIINAGLLAPTARNFQPERIIVVENEAILEKLKEATRFTFDAKTIFVVAYNKEESWKRGYDFKDHGDIDATIVATMMMLEATSLGIGTTFVCSFDEEKLKDILSLDAKYSITCLLPAGYPKDILPHNSRKDLEDIVIYK